MPPPAHMRLRITRQLCESIDGIQFSAFRLGYAYEVGTTIANYLLASGAAEPVADDHPYLILPPEKHLFYPAPTVAVGPRSNAQRRPMVMPAAMAADRPPRRRAQQNRKLRIRRGTRAASGLRARVAALAKTVEQIKDELARLRRAS
ncbi:MAG TPA: hypothetical protein VFU28_01710 [Vicinamibacterales bacterium]|nr:hypothetical protein [Vicinamibacterales bacterium]